MNQKLLPQCTIQLLHMLFITIVRLYIGLEAWIFYRFLSRLPQIGLYIISKISTSRMQSMPKPLAA